MKSQARRLVALGGILVAAYGTLEAAIQYVVEHRADAGRHVHVLPLVLAFAILLSRLRPILDGTERE